MDRKDFYFREKVTEAELDGGFTDVENADRNQYIDAGLVGIMTGLVVAEHAPQDLTVNVGGPGSAYDAYGRRIHVPTTQNVNCAVDYDGVPTAVLNPGNSKYLSLFVEFDRLLSDPRIDGNGATVYFEQDEYYRFYVRQGAEAVSPSYPPLEPDKVLLGDILITFGTAAIVNAMIEQTGYGIRRQDVFVGSSIFQPYREGTIPDAIAAIAALIDAHRLANPAHSADQIELTVTQNWKDGSSISGVTCDTGINEIVSDLGALTGAPKVGAAATGGSPTALVDGSVKSQIDALLAAVNLRTVAAALASQVTPGSSLVGCDAVAGTYDSLVAGDLDTQLASLTGFLNTRLKADGTVPVAGNLVPDATGTRDLGAGGGTPKRWSYIFGVQGSFSSWLFAAWLSPSDVTKNPSSSAERDSLNIINTPKAHGSVSSAGVLGPNYRNIASAVRNGNGDYTITMAIGFADTNYTVVATVHETEARRIAIAVDRVTGTRFDVLIEDNDAPNDRAFGFVVMGGA